MASSTGGDPGQCISGVPGDPPRLEVKANGQVLMSCGGAKTFVGAFAKLSGSTLKIYDSENCTQTGTLYEVTGVNFSISPTDFGDACSQARVEWASTPPCDVTGFGLANGGDPLYVGAFGRTLGPSGYTAFSTDSVFDCGCVVDDVKCCDHVLELDQETYPPGRYTLKFPGAMSDIGEQESIVGTVDQNEYLFTNLRSHVRESCDPAPSHEWLDFRWWAVKTN